MHETEFQAVNRRHGELVDRKFLAGLTPDEESELELLARRIEEEFEPFYRPILARLRGMVAQGYAPRCPCGAALTKSLYHDEEREEDRCDKCGNLWPRKEVVT